MTEVTNLPYRDGVPFSTATPFTYREGVTHLEMIRALKTWAGKVVPELNGALDEFWGKYSEDHQALLDDLQSTKDEWQALFDAFMVNVVNELEALNDQAVANLVNSEVSKLRQALDAIYATHSEQADYETALNLSFNTFKDTMNSDTNAFKDALTSDFNTFKSDVNGALDQFMAHVNGALANAVMQPGIGNMIAAFKQSMTRTNAVVFLGSSTTAGLDQDYVDRYTSILVKKMQMKYASGYGAESRVASGRFGTISQTSGIHGYNFGDGGLTSRTFLGTERLGRIALMQPAVVISSIGANDAVYGYTAAEVKANVRQMITDIDAVVSVPPTYILIHQHELDKNDISVLWSEYREALRELSFEMPNRVTFIDVSKEFAAVGVPGNDYHGYMQADRVHLTRGGQHMMGEIVSRKLGIDDENRSVKRMLARDYFAREETVGAGISDTGQRWLDSGNWTVSNGEMKTSLGGGSPLVWLGTPDQDVAVVIEFATPSTNTYGGICVRSQDARNRLSILCSAGTSKKVALYANIENVQTALWAEPYDFVDGGSYTLRVIIKGREMNVYVNGALVKEYLFGESIYGAIGDVTGAGLHCSIHAPSITYKRFRAYEAK